MYANFTSSNLERLTFSSDSLSISDAMARVETEAKNSKLSVAETLKQATIALETHRSWMRRRVSTSVAPWPLDETENRNGGETSAFGNVKGNSPRAVSVSWALRSGKEIKYQHANQRAESPTNVLAQRAPPPSLKRAEQRGASTTLIPLTEETDNGEEQQEENGSSVTSPSSQGKLNLLESPTTPFPQQQNHHGPASPDTLLEELEPTPSDRLHFTFPSSSETKQTNFKVKKKLRIGKASVLPLSSCSSTLAAGQTESSNENHFKNDMLDSSHPKSPEVFIGESFHGNLSTQPPPPVSMLVAWGSLTSLENHKDSLEATSSGKQKLLATSQQDSRRSADSLPLESKSDETKQEVTSVTSANAANLEFESLNSQSLESSYQVQSPSTQTTDQTTPSPPKDQEGEDSFENSTSTEHFEALKATSSATVIPVTPAPRSQRSSYTLHKQSKLTAAEADTKIYDVKHERSSNPSSDNQLTSNGGLQSLHSFKNPPVSSIPESVLQSVLPKHQKRTAKLQKKSEHTSFASSSDQTGVSRHVSQDSQLHSQDENEENIYTHSPTNFQPTSLQNSTKSSFPDGTTTQPHDTSFNEEPTASQRDKELLSPTINEAKLIRSQSSPANRSVVGAPKKDCGPSEAEGHSKQACSGDGKVPERSRSSPKLKSKALESIKLPPLKTNTDGAELVKDLPLLKVQTPLTPHLKAFSSLSCKRERRPPPYIIHRLAGGMALAPACPAYGTQQPSESDVLQVISSHRGSLSPDDMDALLSVGATSRRPSTCNVVESVYSLNSPSADNSGPPMYQDLPSKPIGHAGGRGHSDKDGAGADRRLSVVALRSSQPARDERDVTTVEDIEMAESFQVGATLVSGGSTGSHGNRKLSGQGEDEELMDIAQSSQGALDDHVGVSAHTVRSSTHYTSLGPGPLHLAAKSGNLRRLQSLINKGHDVDLPDQEGRTPLMYCIHSRGVHLSCADALIQGGANLNKQSSDGSTAMHFAASVGALSLIELLLLNGANPDVRDFEGRLPLHWATIQNNPKTITLLLKSSNFNINVTDDAGMTPLMWSAYHNNLPITSFLLVKGADHEEKDIDGYTAMHWAIHRTGTECLRLLLKPDMTYFKDHRGRTVIHLAAKDGAMAACELIIKMRRDAIFDTDKQGHTPLHYAAACSRVDICALLLDLGADATQRDSEGLSALDYARRKKLDYVVALLTCHGTAVADFARASRSTSINSLLSRTISFSQLNVDKEEQKEEGEQGEQGKDVPCDRRVSERARDLNTGSSNLCSKSLTNINTLSGTVAHSRLLEDDGQLSLSSGHLDKTAESASSLSHSRGNRDGDNEEEMETAKGGYLGRFTDDRRDPIKHFYFWLRQGQGSICWSRLRENAKRSSHGAIVIEVHKGPSQSVKKNPSYSPGDLHKHIFWVMTGGGILDLFAYNEDAYEMWLENISSLASKNAQRGIENLPLKKQSKTNVRPSSTHGRHSRAMVAPINYVTNDTSTTSSSTLTFEPSASLGEANLIRDGGDMSSIKVATAWTSSNSSLYDQEDIRSEGNRKNSVLNRSLSVPAHLLPLTSTPQYAQTDRVLPSPEVSAQYNSSRSRHTCTPNPQPTSDDVI